MRSADRPTNLEVELTAEEVQPSENETPEQPVARPRRTVLLGLVALVAWSLDILTKVLVVAELENKADIRLLGGFLTLTVIRNPGAAFGIAGGLTIVLTVIMAAVIVAIVKTATRLRSRGWAVALGLILGGALGNLVDRLLRAPGPFLGHVVDWIQVPYWPVFNLADSAIVCGGVLTVVLAIRGIGLDGTRAAGKSEGGAAGRE